MKILIVDPIGGISGDMLLGGLVHLGCPTEYLEEIFDKLNIEPFSMHAKEDSINGISCIGLRFDIPESHEVRTYASIRDTILPGLPEAVRNTAEKVFQALAQAESEVHGCAVEDVHFHEIGALDSILDIAGIAAALDYLGVETLYSRPVPLGSGLTNSLHGMIPIPAPATVKLLEGIKVRPSPIEAELTTPTGAAVLKALAERGDPPEVLIIESVGYGCGSKRFDNWPNLCRVMLCDADTTLDSESIFKVEADIDDMMPEDAGAAQDRIMDAGARDVGVEFHSLSKTYNMTGWRLGFAVGNREVIAGLGQIKSNIDSGAFNAVQWAGIAALEGDQGPVADMQGIYAERRDILIAGLRKAGLDPEIPKATFYVWCPNPPGFSSKDFTSLLLREAGRVVTREFLVDAVLSRKFMPFDRSID
ncbi:MAG: nickel insertion protein, partial [Desulfomonilia bacterium]